MSLDTGVSLELVINIVIAIIGIAGTFFTIKGKVDHLTIEVEKQSEYIDTLLNKIDSKYNELKVKNDTDNETIVKQINKLESDLRASVIKLETDQRMSIEKELVTMKAEYDKQIKFITDNFKDLDKNVKEITNKEFKHLESYMKDREQLVFTRIDELRQDIKTNFEEIKKLFLDINTLKLKLDSVKDYEITNVINMIENIKSNINVLRDDIHNIEKEINSIYKDFIKEK